jgi:hypothetical protein
MAKACYTEADLEFGAGLISNASIAFENAWHFAETLEKKKIEQELEVAAGIQRDLFPKKIPELQATNLAARNRQARQVGGDYYDILPVGACGPDHPHLLCVADISGSFGVAARRTSGDAARCQNAEPPLPNSAADTICSPPHRHPTNTPPHSCCDTTRARALPT